MKKRLWPRILILLCTCSISVAVSALAVPQTITYQGLLRDEGELATGTRSVTFRIYDAVTGGASLWEEVQSVEFDNGVFSVVLGSELAIPVLVFNGSRRWLSVSIEGGEEVLPRPEMVSVGYAFHAETADDALTLDGYESWEFAGALHTHDSRYHTKAALATTDGDPPNEGSEFVHWDLLTGVPPGFADGIDATAPGPTDHGSLTGLNDDDHPQYAQEVHLRTSDSSPPNEGTNQVHWDNLNGVPADFADGEDDVATGGVTDHGELTGLNDDDHPQYAQEVLLKTSDGTGPNVGSNQVNWDNLLGVPGGFADSTDDGTTDASDIVTGTMGPERIAGIAVTQDYAGLLTGGQKDSLTSGGMTTLHYHPENGVVVHKEADDYESTTSLLDVVTSVTIDVPTAGFLHISFSGMQVLSLWPADPGPGWDGQRYIAEYGIAVDDSADFGYFIRSSMLNADPDAVAMVLDEYLPQNSVAGTTVYQVDAGPHTVYLMTDVVHKFEVNAMNRFFKPSLVVGYFPFGETHTPQPPMPLGAGAGVGRGDSATDMR